MGLEESPNIGLPDELKDRANRLLKSIGKPSSAVALEDERLAALQESKQFAMQFRDDSMAWQEAYLAERKRADLLQAKLFEIMGLSDAAASDSGATAPIKHVVQSQIGKRSLSFRERRATIESMFSAHDAGIYQKEENQDAS